MEIINFYQKSKKSVKFSEISYSHSDDFTEFVSTKCMDGLTFQEQIFEEFIITVFNRKIPFMVAIKSKKFKLFKNIIIMRIIRLVEKFEQMMEKNPDGYVFVTKYTKHDEPYIVHKKIRVPIIPIGGGKPLTITIDNYHSIRYLKYYVS